MSLTPSVLLKPPAPAPHAKQPPGGPPDTPFATVLDDHQARTAAAEGHQRSDTASAPVAAGDARAAARRDGDRDRTRAANATHDGPKHDGRSTGALAALLGAVPAPGAIAAAGVARLPAAPQPGEPALPSSATPVARPPLAPMPIGPAIPAAASALALGPDATPGAAPPPPSAVAPTGPAAGPAAPAAPEQAAQAAPALPGALTAVARALHASAAPGVPAAQTATTSASPAPTTTAAPVAARAAPGPSASGHLAPPAPAPSVAPAPAAPTPAAQATDPTAAADNARGVALDHAVETVRLALRASADRGVTQARISLNPRELGSIEVHLRQTADGLVARVVAQHAAAAQLLQHAGADLRRQLEQSGLTLLRLDIGASGEQGGRAADGRAPAGGGSRRAAPAAGAPLGDAVAETTATATLALPNGALVDVLA